VLPCLAEQLFRRRRAAVLPGELRLPQPVERASVPGIARQIIAERLRRLVNARPFATNLGSIAVTASFGVCGVEDALPGREDLTAQMVIAADSALYTSKRQGRNRVTEGSAAPQAR